MVVLALVAARRASAFGPSAQGLLAWATAAWAFGALEVVPHLLAAGEAHELAHHEATPVLDLHLLLQLAATPAVGLGGALLAVAVARAARTRTAWVLAAVAVVGGVGYAASAPLVLATGDVRFTLLFPLQAGLAVWLAGTGVRLLVGRRIA